MALKYFTKPTYNSLGELLADIKKELQSLTPVDSDSIQWDRSADGLSAHVTIESAGTEQEASEESVPVDTGYNGFFKLVDMSETDANGVTHYRLGIADGATFDGKTSGPSVSVSDGNGESYYVPFHVIDVPDEVTETLHVVLPYSTTEGAGLARLLPGGHYNTSVTVLLGWIGINYEQKKLWISQVFTDGVLHFNIHHEGAFTVSITHTDVYEDGVPKIIICNGANIDSDWCGTTDVVSFVPKFTLPRESYSQHGTRLYIGARYNQEEQESEVAFYTDESYSEKPSWANDKDSHGEITLGYIWHADGYWEFQYFRKGDIVWGKEFYIP